MYINVYHTNINLNNCITKHRLVLGKVVSIMH